MTKKDFERAAAQVRAHQAYRTIGMLPLAKLDLVQSAITMRDTFVEFFSASPGFDVDRFYRACEPKP